MDFYQQMLFIQVLMCLYIIVFYPTMEAEETSSLLTQFTKN